MAQHDFNIANATFPSVRSDINSALTAINTTQSGTSRPASAVAGTIWLDTTSATSPTLKYYDGADDISLATLDHSANTVNWLDSTVSITGLSSTATGTVLTLTDSDSTSTVNLIIDNQKEVRFNETTANGTNYIGLKAPASVSADLTFTLPVAPTADNQALIASTAGVMSFTPYAFPSADGTANQVIQTNGSGILSFATISAGTPTVDVYDTGTAATYTKPATANWMLVELWGGGGSGGRSNGTNAAAGGGGGSYNYAQIPFADLVGDVTYTVAAGGAGKTVAGDGNVGGTTSISFANFQGLGTTKTISAFGGGGGGSALSGTNNSTAAGGGGGTQTAAGGTGGNNSGSISGGNDLTHGVNAALGETQTNLGTFGSGGNVVHGCGVPGAYIRSGASIFGGGGGGGGRSTTGGAGANTYYGGGGGSGARSNTGGTSIWGGSGSSGVASGTVSAAGELPAGGSAGAQAANSGNGGGGRVRFTYW